MKKYIFGVSIAIAFFGTHAVQAKIVCTETEYSGGYIKTLPTTDMKEVFQLENPLFKDGKVKYYVTLGQESPLQNVRCRIEEGTLENVKYRIWYTGGSGAVQGLATNTLEGVKDQYGTNWSINVKFDKMDDTHSSYLNRGDLMVGIWKDGTPFVRVGSNHYPNTIMAIRIDKNEPITAPESSGYNSSQTTEIIEQLKKGRSYLTRYQEWPHQQNKDIESELFGFAQAWTILQKIHGAVKRQ